MKVQQKHRSDQKFPIIFLILGMLCSLLMSCNRAAPKQDEAITKYEQYFDTLITLTVYQKSDEEYIKDCFALAAKYENMFSKTKPESDIYKLNHAKGKAVTVASETALLIQQAIAYSKKSDGIFDITIGALSSLWDIKNNEGRIPDEASINKALATISYQSIHINGDTIQLKNPQTQLDLGGIAKGYVADKMKEYLTSKGVTQAIINLGGNILALGEKNNGQGYTFGIQKPFSDQRESIATISIRDQTVVTSGIYERYFEKDGIIYHHILDPATGYPIQNDLYSVTIICQNSAHADALSTICYSLGLEKGLAFIEAEADTEAIFITDDHQIHTTKGIRDNYEFRNLSLIFRNAGNP